MKLDKVKYYLHKNCIELYTLVIFLPELVPPLARVFYIEVVMLARIKTKEALDNTYNLIKINGWYVDTFIKRTMYYITDSPYLYGETILIKKSQWSDYVYTDIEGGYITECMIEEFLEPQT